MSQPSTEKKVRTAKSPEQKAQEALDVSGRKLVRLHDRKDTLLKELDEVAGGIEEQEKEHAYLSQNPHLNAVQQRLDVGTAEESEKPQSLRITQAVVGEKGE